MDYKRLLRSAHADDQGREHEDVRNQSQARFVCSEKTRNGKAVVDRPPGHSQG